MRISAAPPPTPCRDPLYRGYRFPAEIISHAVWRYYRFALSHRDVEELLAERGVRVSYEAIRLWCRKFGSVFASRLRHLLSAPEYRQIRTERFRQWREVVGLAPAV